MELPDGTQKEVVKRSDNSAGDFDKENYIGIGKVFLSNRTANINNRNFISVPKGAKKNSLPVLFC